MKKSNVFIAGILCISCFASRTEADHTAISFYKDFDLVKLQFEGPIPSPNTLPYIKVYTKGTDTIRAEFFLHSRKIPSRVMRPLRVNGLRAFASESFDGKHITQDTLISTSEEMFEWRYFHGWGKLVNYECFHYLRSGEDSLTVLYFQVSDAWVKKTLRPSTAIDSLQLAEIKPILKAQFYLSLKNNLFTCKMVSDDIPEIAQPISKRTDYSLYWSLYSNSFWASYPRKSS